MPLRSSWRSANSHAVDSDVAVKSPTVTTGIVSPLAALWRHESSHGNAFWQQTLADELTTDDQEMKGRQVDLPIHHQQFPYNKGTYSQHVESFLVKIKNVQLTYKISTLRCQQLLDKFKLQSNLCCQLSNGRTRKAHGMRHNQQA